MVLCSELTPFKTLTKIREEGTTILIVEQNALATLKIADYASDEQRMALSERIIQGKNRGMTCREWENLTGTKAAELLQNSDWPQETISERVRLLADEYLKLTQEERILFFETIKQRTKA